MAAARQAGESLQEEQDAHWKPTGRVYLILLTLAVSSLFPALEATVVALALPAITRDLGQGTSLCGSGASFFCS